MNASGLKLALPAFAWAVIFSMAAVSADQGGFPVLPNKSIIDKAGSFAVPPTKRKEDAVGKTPPERPAGFPLSGFEKGSSLPSAAQKPVTGASATAAPRAAFPKPGKVPAVAPRPNAFPSPSTVKAPTAAGMIPKVPAVPNFPSPSVSPKTKEKTLMKVPKLPAAGVGGAAPSFSSSVAGSGKKGEAPAKKRHVFPAVPKLPSDLGLPGRRGTKKRAETAVVPKGGLPSLSSDLGIKSGTKPRIPVEKMTEAPRGVPKGARFIREGDILFETLRIENDAPPVVVVRLRNASDRLADLLQVRLNKEGTASAYAMDFSGLPAHGVSEERRVALGEAGDEGGDYWMGVHLAEGECLAVEVEWHLQGDDSGLSAMDRSLCRTGHPGIVSAASEAMGIRERVAKSAQAAITGFASDSEESVNTPWTGSCVNLDAARHSPLVVKGRNFGGVRFVRVRAGTAGEVLAGGGTSLSPAGLQISDSEIRFTLPNDVPGNLASDPLKTMRDKKIAVELLNERGEVLAAGMRSVCPARFVLDFEVLKRADDRRCPADDWSAIRVLQYPTADRSGAPAAVHGFSAAGGMAAIGRERRVSGGEVAYRGRVVLPRRWPHAYLEYDCGGERGTNRVHVEFDDLSYRRFVRLDLAGGATGVRDARGDSPTLSFANPRISHIGSFTREEYVLYIEASAPAGAEWRERLRRVEARAIVSGRVVARATPFSIRQRSSGEYWAKFALPYRKEGAQGVPWGADVVVQLARLNGTIYDERVYRTKPVAGYNVALHLYEPIEAVESGDDDLTGGGGEISWLGFSLVDGPSRGDFDAMRRMTCSANGPVNYYVEDGGYIPVGPPSPGCNLKMHAGEAVSVALMVEERDDFGGLDRWTYRLYVQMDVENSVPRVLVTPENGQPTFDLLKEGGRYITFDKVQDGLHLRGRFLIGAGDPVIPDQ